MRRKFAIFTALVSLAVPATVIASTGSAPALAPGQCKNVGGTCNGGSEFAPPHCAQFPQGQEKKCS